MALGSCSGSKETTTTTEAPTQTATKASAAIAGGTVALAGEHPLGNGWIGAAQPSQPRVKQLAKNGVWIVSLRAPAEDPFDEAAVVKANGGVFKRFPVNGGTLTNKAARNAIFDTLDEAEKKGVKVYLHCASSNRVGATWALYQKERKGMAADKAEAKGKAAGMSSMAPIVEKVLAQP